MSESQLPQILVDTLKRPSGLILLSGNRQSNLEETLNLSADVFKSEKNREVYKVQNQAAIPSSADILIYSQIRTSDDLMSVVRFAEEGRLVLAPVMAMSLMGALHKIYSEMNMANKEHWLWRFADSLQLLILQLSVTGVEQSERVKIYEVLLPSTQLRKMIVAEDVRAIETQMKIEEESTGLLSLNRSLFQNIIRRKIDLKTAFEITRDPEDLDLILKKAGV